MDSIICINLTQQTYHISFEDYFQAIPITFENMKLDNWLGSPTSKPLAYKIYKKSIELKAIKKS